MVLSKPNRFVEADAPGKRNSKAAEGKDVAEAKADKGGKNNGDLGADIPAADPKKIFRVTFNEITPKAIRAAFEHPRGLDTNLVDAQQARRVLDRIAGEKIWPPPGGKARRRVVAGGAATGRL